MAVIKKLNMDEQSKYILEELDSESCMVSPEKLPELERKVKEVGLFDSALGFEDSDARRLLKSICPMSRTTAMGNRRQDFVHQI
jgi:hypothetical protein